ncbi:MAG: hypothetical protein HY516_04935 [Candidatus Aenigmarchaeota archaeon]|nr:hypothetical protein [Candidatus Aenigmarchaeota archaeon]
MVSTKVWGDKTVFACDECGFKYADAGTAKECENFCRTHNACDPKITALAIAK